MEFPSFNSLILSSILFINIFPVRSAASCSPASCHPDRGPKVRFPFRLVGRQPSDCGSASPGFDLTCNHRNQTIITLPRSGDFIVSVIDYSLQSVFLEDPDACLARRAMNFSLAGTRFHGLTWDFAYYNCSDPPADGGYYVRLPCLSAGTNGTTMVVTAALDSPTPPPPPPPRCRRFAEVSIPLRMKFGTLDEWWEDEIVVLKLDWSEPAACGRCDGMDSRICAGYQVESGREIGCPKKDKMGLPRGAKYAIIVGVGVPGLLCMVGLICYALGLVRTSRFRRVSGPPLPTARFSIYHDTSPASGLDQPTIESYPMTVLGASRRLPKPSDNTCSICLCEYEPKDSLRSIPDCNHYFHADCIDEWLKMNATCPVCRNSPKTSSTATTCSSASLSTPSETAIER